MASDLPGHSYDAQGRPEALGRRQGTQERHLDPDSRPVAPVPALLRRWPRRYASLRNLPPGTAVKVVADTGCVVARGVVVGRGASGGTDVDLTQDEGRTDAVRTEWRGRVRVEPA